RDLALSSLIKAHFFNLEKALATPLSQKRVVSVSGKKIELYPGLTEDQYEAIIRFAYQEKWPLTTKGLFIALKNRLSQGLQDESLFSALMTTSEFHKVQVLFQKTGAEEDPKTLLSLLTDGSWEMLEKFSQEQSELLDLSLEKRRSFLMNYLAFRSKNAATLLLKTDLLFTKTRLSDPGILSILELLSDPSDLVKQFCIDLLHSPRSDAIREAAGLTLYRFSGEAPPVPFDSQVALERFSQASILEKPKPSTPTQKEKSSTSFRSKEHVVQEGETLWKISRQYKVKVDEIMRMNGLEKESLVPGMILRVPGQGTGSNPPR
ncbi:MAG: LysM peptidoglycan-binding domain-containing protein, partial [Chlamydiae bacterium]|nr:LysM peptidoglycan-binding domain-containing protein [Chlamydiota bacterium]